MLGLMMFYLFIEQIEIKERIKKIESSRTLKSKGYGTTYFNAVSSGYGSFGY